MIIINLKFVWNDVITLLCWYSECVFFPYICSNSIASIKYIVDDQMKGLSINSNAQKTYLMSFWWVIENGPILCISDWSPDPIKCMVSRSQPKHWKTSIVNGSRYFGDDPKTYYIADRQEFGVCHKIYANLHRFAIFFFRVQFRKRSEE